jgi:hypothetical protein
VIITPRGKGGFFMRITPYDKERAKLKLAFTGLAIVRNAFPGAVNKKDLYMRVPEEDQDSPAVAAVLKSRGWVKGYLHRMVKDGLLVQIGLKYKVGDMDKVCIILSDEKNYGAEKLGWYISPKEVPLPWGEEINVTGNEADDTEEVDAKEEYDEDEYDEATDSIKVKRSLAIVITNALQKVMDLQLRSSKELGEKLDKLASNSVLEELQRIKTKMNNLDTRQQRIEAELQRRADQGNTKDLEAAVELMRDEVHAQFEPFQGMKETLETVHSSTEAVRIIVSGVSSKVHEVTDALKKERERDAKFFMEYLETTVGDNKNERT